MEDTIIISDDEEEEDDESRGAQLLTESRDSTIIDLTNNRCALGNLPELDNSVIDLTANEDGLGLSPVSSPFKDELSSSDSSEVTSSLPSNSSSGVISEDEWTSGCSWTPDRDTTSIEDGVLQRDVSTSRKDKCLTDEVTRKESLTDENTRKDKCLTYKSNLTELSDIALPLHHSQRWLNETILVNNSHYATTFPNVNYQPQSTEGSITSLPTAEPSATFPNVNDQLQSNGGSIFSLPTAEQSSTRSFKINKALLYKLRCFKKLPVSHFLHGLEKPGKSGPVKPIPQSRMSIMNNTREESIHQGTLHFLSEFVSAEHYPPKDIIMHVIQSILLGAEEQAIQHEAYMTLMKVQKLHPADVNTVAWDWSLISEVMERKENHTYHLFFQYVVQTLDDDFQIHLQRRCFQKSLCKKVLSCDKANIKKVIAWLIHAVENACDIAVNRDARSECRQRVVFLLQRMLSIAVEVDNLPVTNSNRIANLLFPYVIVLKTKQQRELFFSSTENHLLRAKVLELIFINSCEPVRPPDLPLSLRKILHFICKITLLLENQGPEWQRWDEILHHISLLFLSLQRIISDCLRTPIIDRGDEILRRPQIQLPFYEDVTEQDVEQCLLLFWRRSTDEADVPIDLQNRFYMLKSLLLTAVKRPIL